MSIEETLDHPCRDTCSGWKQGYDRGFSVANGVAGQKEYAEIYAGFKELRVVKAQLQEARAIIQILMNRDLGNEHNAETCGEPSCVVGRAFIEKTK